MLVVLAIHEADGQDVTVQDEVAYALVTGGGKPGQGYPAVLISESHIGEMNEEEETEQSDST